MKRVFLALSILSALIVTTGAFAAKANTEAKKTDRATVEFKEPVKLLNVMLKGEYLFVHDEEKMAKGEDCTAVYDNRGKLVVSFHCVPVERRQANSFRIVKTRITGDLYELKEYQFAGDTEAHQVP
jgi:hypothetical protein